MGLVAVELTPCALLFLRFGFGIPGVFGLFSTLLFFLSGGMLVFNEGGGAGVAGLLGTCNGPLAVTGTISLSLSFLPVEER